MKGGALPTRGESSYRRLQKPEAWARVARFCPFSCFHCGGRALGAPRPARTPLPLARAFRWVRMASKGFTSSAFPDKKRLVELGRRLGVTYCQ